MGSLPLDNIQLTDGSILNQLYVAPVETKGLVGPQLDNISKQLTGHATNINTNLGNLQNISDAQNTMYTIATLENQRLQDKKRNIDDALQGQNRMISLNDSYVKKYAKYNQIVMVVVLVILAILGAILLPTYLPFIPSFIGDLIIILAVAIGGITIFMIYLGIQARDPLYFDKLNIPGPTIKDLSDNALDMSLNSIQTGLLGGLCIGQDCCTDPAQFINSKGKCVNPPPEIYDYSTGKYRVCSGTMTCPSDGVTQDDINKKTWKFDTENNTWINGYEYWNLTENQAKTLADLATGIPAPTVTQGFTTMQPSSVEPMQSSETSEYSFYR
jgi:hypothetical protein